MNERPVAIVTGASSGIGAATAIELARQEHDVALVALDVVGLKFVQSAIVALGRQALVMPGDLTDLEFAKGVVRQTIDHFGRIDALVNNAMWREMTTMRHISLDSWERTLRIGLTTPAFLARWVAAEAMEPRGKGVIVNISSMMARQAAGISPAYIACKGGLESLTYELAALYGPCGIRVLTISPGAIDTEMSKGYAGEHSIDIESELRQYSEEMIMLGRWGTSQEIANLIAFAISPAASYLTATTLTADGGWQHQHWPHSLRRRLVPSDFV